MRRNQEPLEAAACYAEGIERRRGGDLDGAARCFLDAIAADPMLFDAGQALAETIADEVRGGRTLPVPRRALPPRPPPVSVVVCSIRPDRFARIASTYRRLLDGLHHQVIGVHDAKSLCDGYERGLRASRGDVLVFSHDDIDVLAPDFAGRLLQALDGVDLLGVVGATRLAGPAWGWAGHPDVHGWIAHRPGGRGAWRAAFWSPWPAVRDAVLLDGALIAGRRHVFESVGFDGVTFDGFHCYDIDFTWRASRAGHRIGVLGGLGLVHESLGHFDDGWRRYADRFVAKFPAFNEAQRPSHRYEVALPSVELARAFFGRLEALAAEALEPQAGHGAAPRPRRRRPREF